MHEYTKYFKEDSGFERLINKLYEKYQSLGKISGTIRLEKITNQEAKAVSRLFGITYQEKDNIILSIKKLVTIMKNSKYDDFDIEILVTEYLNIELHTKKELRQNKDQEEIDFYKKLIITTDSTNLEKIIEKRGISYKTIHQKYLKNKELLKKEIINIMRLIDNLPTEKVMLPLFASTYTKDPHYLDLDTNRSNLFFTILTDINNLDYPTTREKKIKLLSNYNIEIDNLSNYVLTYNLISDRTSINDFGKRKESLILNIQNILNTKTFDSKIKKVFIFENPSILTEIISKNLDVSVIITGGFPNTSIYLLIDKLITQNNIFYYNGDFDPEGLLIAEKLKDKYKDYLTLFCYDKIDYEKCISKHKVTDSRLKKITKLETKELEIIKELLLNQKMAGYQENNKEGILKFILNEVNK